MKTYTRNDKHRKKAKTGNGITFKFDTITKSENKFTLHLYAGNLVYNIAIAEETAEFLIERHCTARQRTITGETFFISYIQK